MCLLYKFCARFCKAYKESTINIYNSTFELSKFMVYTYVYVTLGSLSAE